MNDSPQVQPLPYSHRVWFFRSLVTIFVLSVPVFIFYAMGYRVNIFENPGKVITVGGMFISTETDVETQIFINNSLVDNYRLFQKAAYIQSLPAGLHRVHVQGSGLQTWVKDLPVYSHIVTEANAFNLPKVPQLRVVTPYNNSAGTPVVLSSSSSMPASGTVLYRNDWIATTSRATTTLQQNTEYEYLISKFASSTETKTLLERFTSELEHLNIISSPNAATSSAKELASTTISATTTKVLRDRVLQEIEGGLQVTWIGSQASIPYYFCIPYNESTSTMSIYSKKTLSDLAAVYAAMEEPMSTGGRTCRNSIIVGGDWQEIYSFDFYPTNPDLLIIHRSDGVVVKEVDDRAWQNTQVLYPAGEYEFILDNGNFFIKQDDVIFEILETLI